MKHRSAKSVAEAVARRQAHAMSRQHHPKLWSMLGEDYFTVVIPYVEGPGKTKWHPFDPAFAPITRGVFKTTKEARAWAHKHLGPHAAFGIRRQKAAAGAGLA